MGAWARASMQSHVTASSGRAKSPKQVRTGDTFKQHVAELPKEDQAKALVAVEQAEYLGEQAKEAKAAWASEFESIADRIGLSKDETTSRYLLISGRPGIDLNKNTRFGVPNRVKFKDELEHRQGMLVLARGKGQNKLHIGKSDHFLHDPNTDKLLDFILRPEDEGTLANLSQNELQSRVSESNSGALLHPEVILDYISGEKIQRRFYWVKAGDVPKMEAKEKDGKGNPARKTAKDPGYTSNDLQEKDRNTAEWGHYLWKTKQFVPWVPVNRKDLEPFMPALWMLVTYVQKMNQSQRAADKAGHATRTATRSEKHADHQFLQQQKRSGQDRFKIPVKSQRVQDVCARVDNIQASEETRVVLNNILKDRITNFERTWNEFARHLEDGLLSMVCMNKMFEIVRSLCNSNALVFSDRSGHKYDPTSCLTFRSLNDHLSYADERLMSLIKDYDLTDSDGKVNIKTNKKVFHTADMQDNGEPPYELPPYVFYFDTKTKVIKLAEGGSGNFSLHYPQLAAPIKKDLDLFSKQYATDYEEVLLRRKNLEDPIYRAEPLNPLIAPFSDVGLLQEEVLCKKASFEDLADASFPYRNTLFLDVRFPDYEARLVTNGRRNGVYIKRGDSDWKPAELTNNGTEVIIGPVSQDDAYADSSAAEEAYESEEPH